MPILLGLCLILGVQLHSQPYTLGHHICVLVELLGVSQVAPGDILVDDVDDEYGHGSELTHLLPPVRIPGRISIVLSLFDCGVLPAVGEYDQNGLEILIVGTVIQILLQREQIGQATLYVTLVAHVISHLTNVILLITLQQVPDNATLIISSSSLLGFHIIIAAVERHLDLLKPDLLCELPDQLEVIESQLSKGDLLLKRSEPQEWQEVGEDLMLLAKTEQAAAEIWVEFIRPFRIEELITIAYVRVLVSGHEYVHELQRYGS